MIVDTLPTLSEIDEAIEAQHRRYTPLRNWLQPGIQTIPTRRRIVAIERIDEHTVRVRYQEYASIR